ncbi:ribonuclease H-like domain-containing protein [Nanoarchaeota archaeon]
MIRNTFQIFPKVAQKKEQNIWKQGIKDWNDFLGVKDIKGISRQKKYACDKIIKSAEQNLEEDNSKYFTNLLPMKEHWRLYEQFKDEAIFLDIETCSYYGNITVVGLSDGYDSKIMIRDINLDIKSLKKELAKYKLLVTFNGRSFDVPVLKRYFRIDFDIPHMDLMHVCRKVGLSGGLKNIEKQLGIKRPESLKYVGGDDAAELWRCWKATGDKAYLEMLAEYNEEDILNLKPIADFAVGKLKKQFTQYL